tara:strand:- start:18 stop:1262 length:1245 start_codon:yes stop_codon:yes gene_type:complete
MEAQPDYRKAKVEYNKLNSIYLKYSEKSRISYGLYKKIMDEVEGEVFRIDFESIKQQYDQIKKRTDRLYKEHEEAENKAVEALIKRNNYQQQNLSWSIWENQIKDAGQLLDDYRSKSDQYWSNQQKELRSEMEILKSKIKDDYGNSDYDYGNELRDLGSQMTELFHRINKEFLVLYNDRDRILAEPEEDEFDPFANEVKPGLGAKDGDELALFGGKKPPKLPVRGTIRGNKIYSEAGYVQNGVYPGGKEAFIKKYGYTPQEAIDAYNSGGNSQSSKPKDTNLGSVASYVGGDTTAAATAAAFNKDKKKKNNKGGSTMVAHYQPKGKSLSEKLKLKPFFNPKDIKPTFPENDPPQLDPKTGMHPNYGKQAGRYKKLDPISADSMPPTGDPETDAVVNKQKTKRTFSKIKKFARGT